MSQLRACRTIASHADTGNCTYPAPAAPCHAAIDIAIRHGFPEWQSAMLGYGLIFENESLAQDYLQSGKLVRVLPPEMSPPVSAHHLICSRGFAQYPRINKFLAWIEKNWITLSALKNKTPS